MEFVWKQVGRYRHIYQMSKLPRKEALTLQERKGNQIIKMSCIGSAVELLSNSTAKPGKKADLVIKIAKKFEEHLLE